MDNAILTRHRSRYADFVNLHRRLSGSFPPRPSPTSNPDFTEHRRSFCAPIMLRRSICGRLAAFLWSCLRDNHCLAEATNGNKSRSSKGHWAHCRPHCFPGQPGQSWKSWGLRSNGIKRLGLTNGDGLSKLFSTFCDHHLKNLFLRRQSKRMCKNLRPLWILLLVCCNWIPACDFDRTRLCRILSSEPQLTHNRLALRHRNQL